MAQDDNAKKREQFEKLARKSAQTDLDKAEKKLDKALREARDAEKEAKDLPEE